MEGRTDSCFYNNRFPPEDERVEAEHDEVALLAPGAGGEYFVFCSNIAFYYAPN